ncbi:MAG: outer membrane beta-barrel protein [Brumimicrobium sp.]|nr:outer membrane beta-barrel protein [Brumimicrobium sp.]
MKKILTLCAITLGAFAFNTNAQGFYLDFNAGYGFGFPKNVLGTETHTDIVNGVGSVTTKNLTGSIGQGLNLQLTPGYMINEHIGIELGINYFIGGKTLMNKVTRSINNGGAIVDDEYEKREDIAHSSQLRIAPTVFLSTGITNKISGYAKVGIILPVYGSTIVNTEWIQGSIDNGAIVKEKHEIVTKINGDLSMGFRGALGVNYNITDNISVFGEVFALSLNVKQKNRASTSYKIDGEELVEFVPVIKAQIEYVDELTPESNNPSYNTKYDTSKPLNELYQKTSFSQMGIQVGVKYRF